MPGSLNKLEELVARLQSADDAGHRDEVRDIRRYIAKHYGVDAYRDGRTMKWTVAVPDGVPLPPDNGAEKTDPVLLEQAKRAMREWLEEQGEVAKKAKESRFRDMFSGRQERRDQMQQDWHPEFGKSQERREREAAQREAFRQQQGPMSQEALEKAMREAIQRGDMKVPSADVREEARRRMQEFRNHGRRQTPQWAPPDEWKTSNSIPPPPELPPELHTPSEEETMASINDYFKQEIGT